MSFISKIIVLLLSTILSCLLAIGALDVAYWFKHGEFFFQTTIAGQSSGESIYRSLPSRKPENMFRIVTLGGSTTYGPGISLSETWPKILESKLRKEREVSTALTINSQPIGTEQDVEVLNLGYLGGHLAQIETAFWALPKRRISRKDWLVGERATQDVYLVGLRDLDADLLVVTPVVNDTVSDYFYQHGFTDDACSYLMSGELLSKSAIRYYVCKLAAQLGNRTDMVFDAARASEIVEAFGQRLQRVIDRLGDEDIASTQELILVSLPFLFEEGDKEKEARRASRYWGRGELTSLVSQAKIYPQILELERATIESIARKNNISYVNLSGLFSDMRFRKRLLLFDDSIHTNARGTRKVADALWASLQDVQLVSAE